MIARFRIPPELFTRLAAGAGGPEALALLRAATLSEHLLLFSLVARGTAVHPPALARSVAILAEAQRRAPGVVGRLFALPWTGRWAVDRLRDPAGTDLSYLGALAAVAALRTGLDADVEVSARGGLVVLPELGAVPVDGPAAATVRLAARAGRLTVSGAGRTVLVPRPAAGDADGWLALRTLDARCDGRAASVVLDDLDPLRDCYREPPAGRLGAAEVAEWRRLFQEAWELLVRYAPDRADEVAAGLAVLVPLSTAASGPGRSVTRRDVFGGLGLTRPGDAATFAITLVHELQHSKLNTLQRIGALHDRTVPAHYYSPWRPDPRPVNGLLHGVYAFLAVADVWRRLRAHPALRARAEREFALVRAQVGGGLDTLARCGHLTAPGERFVAGLRASHAALLAEPVPWRADGRARLVVLRDRVRWLVRNRRPLRAGA